MVFLTIVLHRLSVSFVATCMAEEWTSSLNPCNPKDWVRFRMEIIPEGPKKSPDIAKSMTAERTWPLQFPGPRQGEDGHCS